MTDVPMPLAETVIERVTAALKADVSATLGIAHAAVVIQFAEQGRRFIDDDEWFVQWLVDTQQYFHDTFLDTTWPPCPRHPHHPLWFRDNAWRCGEESVAILGRLGPR
jgi:hypothetical protein